jgi:hypothetical protein
MPGLLCAKLLQNEPNTNVIITDIVDPPDVLESIRLSVTKNNLDLNDSSCFAAGRSQVTVAGLTWGDFSEPCQRLLTKCPSIDWILGSDVFYDGNDFENILATVAFILHHHPRAQFLTVYQERR